MLDRKVGPGACPLVPVTSPFPVVVMGTGGFRYGVGPRSCYRFPLRTAFSRFGKLLVHRPVKLRPSQANYVAAIPYAILPNPDCMPRKVPGQHIGISKSEECHRLLQPEPSLNEPHALVLQSPRGAGRVA